MLKIDFTDKSIFGFDPPNLCLLGSKEDFYHLSKLIIQVTGIENYEIDITKLPFVESKDGTARVLFRNIKEARSLGKIDADGDILFEMDEKFWDRLFRFFVLMSWDKSTYYLNSYEDILVDLNLIQDLNIICSSEY